MMSNWWSRQSDTVKVAIITVVFGGIITGIFQLIPVIIPLVVDDKPTEEAMLATEPVETETRATATTEPVETEMRATATAEPVETETRATATAEPVETEKTMVVTEVVTMPIPPSTATPTVSPTTTETPTPTYTPTPTDTVTPLPPTIEAFRVELPKTVDPNHLPFIDLSWEVEGADMVSILPTIGFPVGPLATIGSYEYANELGTIRSTHANERDIGFQLIAKNANPTPAQSERKIKIPPFIEYFTVQEFAEQIRHGINQDNKINLQWKVTNAATVKLELNGNLIESSLPVNNGIHKSFKVYIPSVPVTYTLRALNGDKNHYFRHLPIVPTEEIRILDDFGQRNFVEEQDWGSDGQENVIELEYGVVSDIYDNNDTGLKIFYDIDGPTHVGFKNEHPSFPDQWRKYDSIGLWIKTSGSGVRIELAIHGDVGDRSALVSSGGNWQFVEFGLDNIPSLVREYSFRLQQTTNTGRRNTHRTATIDSVMLMKD
jgi:hypothetical protein